jgi:predicted amidohydrolase YtcJ
MSSDIFFFFNGNIITVDQNFSIYDSFAFHDGKIVFLGKKEEFSNLMTEKYTNFNIIKVDLRSKTVVPGFIDSHMHPIISIYFKTQLQLTHVKNYEDLKTEFDKVIPTKAQDEWILGLDFLEERFPEHGGRTFPTRDDLDKITKTHPIIVLRHDGHICATNSYGLALLGINKESLSNFIIESGRIEVDENGIPTGIFTEGATSILLNQIQIPNFENFTQAGLDFSTEMASHGITSIGAVLQTTEEGPSGSLGSMEFPIIQMLIRENVLLQDFVLYLITDKPKKLTRFDNTIKKLDAGRNQFIVGGIKRFLDGVIGARTAFLTDPFSDGPPNNRGFLIHTESELLEQFKLAYEMGFQLLCHAIGDKAIQTLIDIYKQILACSRISGLESAMRIEHASILSRNLLEEIQNNNIIIACQPSFLESEHTWLRSRLGEERCKMTYPFKSIMESGILLAGASDAPVENPSVLNAIGITIDRFGFEPQEGLSTMQALQMFTINAAKALRQEKMKGSLESGKYADFVILNENILKLQSEEIKKVEILDTYRRGKRIFNKK